MEEYPNWNPGSSGGSDLPRPKKKPAAVPATDAEPKPDTPGSVPSAKPVFQRPEPFQPEAPVQKPTGREPENSREERRSYGRDTMQLRTPLQNTAYDTDFERRRAVPLPPRSSHPQQVRPAKTTPAAKPAPARKPAPAAKKRPAPSAPAAPVRKKRRLSPLGRLVRGIAALAATVFLLYSCAALLLIGRLERLPQEPRTVTDGALDASHVRSILLIGTDARDPSERGRSDSMILASINSRTKKIWLTSFMRDAYVQIPDHGSDKLNAAYAYGGAELLMDTLELNYGVSIDDCMTVSFSGFAGIIDAFGGVEITMSDAEAGALNEILISEVNELMGDARDADLLDGGGTFHLSGKQALSYSRIRYVGNADFERTSRQREVMTQLFGNLKTGLVTAVPELMSAALPHVGTNMSTGEMYLLSLQVPFVLGYDIEQLQIPAEGTWSAQTVGGQSVLTVDFEENTGLLQETVYAASES